MKFVVSNMRCQVIIHTNGWYWCTIAWYTCKKLLHKPHSSKFHVSFSILSSSQTLRHCFQHSIVTKDHVWRSIMILNLNPQTIQVTIGWSPWQCDKPPTISKATFYFVHGIGTIFIFIATFHKEETNIQ